ncbi:MAG: peptidase U32 family protein [Syntrophobacteraceae bacterium]
MSRNTAAEKVRRMPELLAPAGQVESFQAAVENGANAVYLGLNRLSARAYADNFTLDELSTLIPYAHRRNVSVYAALNSAVTAPEFSPLLDTLQALQDLHVDALIVQDPGIFFLVRKFFPDIKLHGSTLMAVHNSAGVNQLERMGATRVVLARELHLNEIEQIASNSSLELEIFVHGALCFSYSGLCMASSFRGGHSGLQGRCVQPCRLKYRQGRKEGYYLSCNDFCALPLVPKLKKLRLAALKIEGRMKSADYVGQVVKAYRLVLDAGPNEEREAVAQAQEWLAHSPSRRLTNGFLGENYNAEILTPHRSGSSGLWVGTVKSVQGSRFLVTLRHNVLPGDRLRPESSEGKEKEVYTVSEIFAEDGSRLTEASAGARVLLPRKGDLLPADRLFKIGVKAKSSSGIWQKIRKDAPESFSYRKVFQGLKKVLDDLGAAPDRSDRSEEILIVKIDSTADLTKAFQSGARWVILSATRTNLERVSRQRLGRVQKESLVWSLPALVSEKDLGYYRPAVGWYQDRGFLKWEVNNWGHFDLFKRGERLNLIAGYRFNVRNIAALAETAYAGCRWSLLSLEITREELELISRGPLSSLPVICLYAWPPLFTSRLIPRLQEEKPFVTPRKEVLFFRKKGENSFIYGDRPINWIQELPFFRAAGFRHFMLDMTGGPRDQSRDFDRLLDGYRRSKSDAPFSLFNLDRRPLP